MKDITLVLQCHINVARTCFQTSKSCYYLYMLFHVGVTRDSGAGEISRAAEEVYKRERRSSESGTHSAGYQSFSSRR